MRLICMVQYIQNQDDGEANMMNEDESLCEKDTQVLECVKKYTQVIDIDTSTCLAIQMVEPVVDVPKSSKRRVVSEKYAKWKHGKLKNAYKPEGIQLLMTDIYYKLLQIRYYESFQLFDGLKG
eukprot:scaffold142637_cov46-Cyclotella_meneghiniana.AAC.1